MACWQQYGSESANLLAFLAATPLSQTGSVPRNFRAPPRSRLPDLGKPLYLEVTPEDSFLAAKRLLLSQEPAGGTTPVHPIVLNLANAYWPGGGFLTGACGQEEELCRRSTLFLELLEADRRGMYPILERGALVSPHVVVFRSKESDKYVRSDTFTVAVVTAAAPCGPDVSTERSKASYRKLMRGKVEALLSVLAHLRYTDIVLSAWGCGAFRNPPEEVANIFSSFLRGRFNKSFRRVVFAIYDRPDWKESNYGVFHRVLLGEPSSVSSASLPLSSLSATN